jgi:integrase
MALTIREVTERYALLRELKPHTIALYAMLWERFERFLGRPATVLDFDDLLVSRYLRWRAETPGWRGRLPSAASVRKDRVMIAAVWTYAARKRWAGEFPELPKIRVPKRLPVGRAYTAADVSQLIRTAKKRIGKVGGLPAKWWWSTLIYCAVCSGERYSALTALRWDQVDLERRRVIFLGSTRKGATRDIERGITPQLAEMMAEHRRGPGDLVWPWDRRTRSQWASLKVLCDSAGVRYRGFHGLRRTAASYAALVGGTAAATALLDHMDPTLQRVYVDPEICPTDQGGIMSLPPLDLDEPPPQPEPPDVLRFRSPEDPAA